MMKLWQALLLTVLIWAGLYLPFLGSNEIRGEEARRILPARTMIGTGDWIQPRVGGEIYDRKPPLINWTIAGSFLLTGVENEWTARLPSVLWVLACGVVCVFALRASLGVRGAFAVALVFFSSTAMLDKGRMAEIEAMYISQTGIAWALFLGWWPARRNWLAYTVPWIFLGLGMLAKGPMHLVFFYGVLVTTLVLAKRRIELVQPPHLAGLVLMTAVFLPWVMENLARSPEPEATSGVWLEQLTARLSYAEIDWGGWVAHPFEMLLNFMPWTVLLLAGAWLTRGVWVGRDYPAERWESAMRASQWTLLGGVILLCLTPEGLPRYLMPLYPVASIVVIDYWQRLASDRRQILEKRWGVVNAWGALGLGVAGFVAAFVIPQVTPHLGYVRSVVGAVVAAVLLFVIHKSFPRQILVRSCLIIAVASTLVFFYAAPIERKQALFRPLAEELRQDLTNPERRLVFYDPGHLRFIFYIQTPYVEVARISDMPEDPGYLVIQPKDLEKEKVEHYLSGFETRQIREYDWEGRDYVLLQLDR